MKIFGVTDNLIEILRSLIIVGEYAPGQKLNEIEVSARFGISRSPLREAFRVLAGEYLVEIIPRRGCLVSQVSIPHCIEIYETREMLECFAIDLLEKNKVRDLPKVEKALEKTEDLKKPDDDNPLEKINYLKSIADFHIKLVESANNSILTAYYNNLFPSLARYQSMYVFIGTLMSKSQNIHHRILNEIKAGDYKKAKKLMKTHLRLWPKMIKKHPMMITECTPK